LLGFDGDVGVQGPEDRVFSAVAHQCGHALECAVFLSFTMIECSQHGAGSPVALPGLFEMLSCSTPFSLHVHQHADLSVHLSGDSELPPRHGERGLHQLHSGFEPALLKLGTGPLSDDLKRASAATGQYEIGDQQRKNSGNKPCHERAGNDHPESEEGCGDSEGDQQVVHESIQRRFRPVAGFNRVRGRSVCSPWLHQA